MPDRPRRRTPWGAFVSMAMVTFVMSLAARVFINSHSTATRIIVGPYLLLGAWILWQRWRSLPRRSESDDAAS